MKFNLLFIILTTNLNAAVFDVSGHIHTATNEHEVVNGFNIFTSGFNLGTFSGYLRFEDNGASLVLVRPSAMRISGLLTPHSLVLHHGELSRRGDFLEGSIDYALGIRRGSFVFLPFKPNNLADGLNLWGQDFTSRGLLTNTSKFTNGLGLDLEGKMLPEPTSVALFGLGAFGALYFRRRKCLGA